MSKGKIDGGSIGVRRKRRKMSMASFGAEKDGGKRRGYSGVFGSVVAEGDEEKSVKKLNGHFVCNPNPFFHLVLFILFLFLLFNRLHILLSNKKNIE